MRFGVEVVLIVTILALLVETKKKIWIPLIQNDLVYRHEMRLRIPKVQSHNFHDRLQSRSMFDSMLNELVVPKTLSCDDALFKKAQKKLRKKSKCEPRELPVDLKAPKGTVVFPRTIFVKRCAGHCSGNQRCLPTATKNTTVYIRMISGGNETYCTSTIIQEHTKCKCNCEINPKQCTKAQIFDRKTCNCRCPEKKVCGMHYIWDNKDCKCVCNKRCTTGTILNVDNCSCIKL